MNYFYFFEITLIRLWNIPKILKKKKSVNWKSYYNNDTNKSVALSPGLFHERIIRKHGFAYGTSSTFSIIRMVDYVGLIFDSWCLGVMAKSSGAIDFSSWALKKMDDMSFYDIVQSEKF